MKCLVTGGTGHIGNTLVRDLIHRGYRVRIFMLPGDDVRMFHGMDVEVCYGDVRNRDDLNAAMKDIDTVFHAAGIIDIGSANKKLMYDVNVGGTKNVVDTCIENGVRTLVYVSSVHALPELQNDHVIHEIDHFSPKGLMGSYAKTKAIATQYVLAAKDKLDVRVVHPSGVIGPYEYITSNIGQLIEDFQDKRLKAYIDGGYNFVDVRDVSNGIILAYEKGSRGECYILGGSYLSVKDLMVKLEEFTGVKAPQTVMPYWFMQVMSFFAEGYYKLCRQKPLFTATSIHVLRSNANFCIEKAQKELGYCCRSIDETLRDTVEWLQSRNRVAFGAI